MIRVLHVFNIMGNGGIEHFVMDRYRMIDRTKVQFDFLITSSEPGFFDKEINELGGKVYHTHSLTKNPLRTFLDIKNIVKANGYSIVHRHTGNAIGYFDLLAARCGGAKHLIIHSHNTNIKISPIDLSEAISHNPNLYSCQKYNPKRDDFYKDLNALPFRKFIKKYDSRSKSQKIKMLVKSFIRKSNNFKGV